MAAKAAAFMCALGECSRCLLASLPAAHLERGPVYAEDHMWLESLHGLQHRSLCCALGKLLPWRGCIKPAPRADLHLQSHHGSLYSCRVCNLHKLDPWYTALDGQLSCRTTQVASSCTLYERSMCEGTTHLCSSLTSCRCCAPSLRCSCAWFVGLPLMTSTSCPSCASALT
jgi:hypothetical protein